MKRFNPEMKPLNLTTTLVINPKSIGMKLKNGNINAISVPGIRSMKAKDSIGTEIMFANKDSTGYFPKQTSCTASKPTCTPIITARVLASFSYKNLLKNLFSGKTNNIIDSTAEKLNMNETLINFSGFIMSMKAATKHKTESLSYGFPLALQNNAIDAINPALTTETEKSHKYA